LVGPSFICIYCDYEEWRNIPEDGILHSHRCENLKSYIEIYPVSDLLCFLIIVGLDDEQNPEIQ
jgi:hypothetical protein